MRHQGHHKAGRVWRPVAVLAMVMVHAATASTAQNDPNAFTHPRAEIGLEQRMDFILGRALFEKLWVSAPASTKASDGLGPQFNARACRSCHIGNGRGHPPDGPDDRRPGFVMRLAGPGATPDPVYGHQLQDRAVPGLAAEGRVLIHYKARPVDLADGSRVMLRTPTYGIGDLAHGPLAAQTDLLPRVAQQMIGLGLLAAIPEANLVARADPDDADRDGISGRLNWQDTPDGRKAGRFGHKAGMPSIHAQSVQAFADDMGLSTPDRPAGWGDCTANQTDCRALPDGNSAIHGDVEVSADALSATVFYAASLAVPNPRSPADPVVQAGKAVFHAAGCASCHQPTHRLDDGRVIAPFTDLLVHDLGPGLADPVGSDGVGHAEWRTAPLWGVGLTKTVTGRQSFLHDGRARTLLEAILWHGGEAQPARDAVTRLTKADRDALITFLESL